MKKIILLLVVLFPFVNFSQKKEVDFSKKPIFGVKTGLNFTITPKDEFEYKSQINFGYQIGGTLNVPISKVVSFQPELLVQKFTFGTSYLREFSNGTITEETKFRYLYFQIPLNFKFNLYKKIDIEFGPNISLLANSKKIEKGVYNIDGEVRTYEVSTNITKNTKKAVLGVNLGTNYNINENIYAGLRYTLFIQRYQTFDSTLNNSVFALSMGYNFK